MKTMYTVFEQRVLLNTRTYTLKEKGLQVYSSSIFKSNQVYVKFEQVGFNKTVYTTRNMYWAFALAFSLFGLIVFFSSRGGFKPNGHWNNSYLFYPFLVLVTGVGYYLTNTKLYILSNNENNCRIDFLTDPDTDIALQDFLVKVKIKRDEYLIESYGQINKQIPYNNQYGHFLWLMNNGVFSQEQYLLKMAQLNQTIMSPNKVIGFRLNNSSNDNSISSSDQ